MTSIRLAAAPFAIALACAACGSEPAVAVAEPANIVVPGYGYRWDPQWDRVLPDAVMRDPTRRPAGPPALVLFGGRRHYFYAAGGDKLAHYVEGDTNAVLTDERLLGAPAAVVAGGNIEVFFRTPDSSNPAIDHVRWNGVYQVLPSGGYHETLATGAWSGPGASTVTVQVPFTIWGTTYYQNVTRVDVFYNHLFWGVTNVNKVGNGPWSAAAPLGGYATSPPSAVSWGPNRLDLFWRAGDKTIQHKWFDGGSWWPASGSEPMMTNAESAPLVTSWGTPRLDIFAVRSDGRLQHVYYAGYGWRGPSNDPAVDCVATVNLATEHDSAGPSGYSAAAQSIDLAIWGTDGNFWHDSYGWGALDTAPSAPTCGCGGDGAACCSGATCGPNLACTGANLCAPCGGLGQQCCAAAACAGGLVCNGATCVTPPPPPPSKWDLLYDNLLSSYCAGCHRSGPNAFLVSGDKHGSWVKLRAYVSNERPGSPIVVAFDPDGSYIYQKVTGAPGITDVRMPKDSPPLEADQVALVRDWIAAGAGE